MPVAKETLMENLRMKEAQVEVVNFINTSGLMIQGHKIWINLTTQEVFSKDEGVSIRISQATFDDLLSHLTVLALKENFTKLQGTLDALRILDPANVEEYFDDDLNIREQAHLALDDAIDALEDMEDFTYGMAIKVNVQALDLDEAQEEQVEEKEPCPCGVCNTDKMTEEEWAVILSSELKDMLATKK